MVLETAGLGKTCTSGWEEDVNPAKVSKDPKKGEAARLLNSRGGER